MRTLVIGYGNDLRTDDGVGPWFAHHLEAMQGPWQAIAVRQLLPEHAELIGQVDLVILVDAARDLPPGQSRQERVEPAANPHLHAHRLDPPGLLAMTLSAYGHAPAMWLIRIGGEAWGLGETLSSTVQLAATKLLHSFPDWFAQISSGTPGVMGAGHHA